MAGRKLLISGGTIRGPGGRRGVAGDHCSWERKCRRRRERERDTHTHTKLSLRETERERW